MSFDNQGSILPGDIRSTLNVERDDAASEINCCIPGTIVSFDPEAGTVQVQPVNDRAVFNNPPAGTALSTDPTIYQYPLLVDVPVFCQAGGQAVLTMPIAAGDSCLVLFCDRDLDPWWSTGNTGVLPNDLTRVHSMADGICLVGIRSKANPIADWDTARAQLRNGTSVVSVGTLIRIANAATTMKAVLDMFAMTLATWENTDSTTPNAATIDNITATQALVDSLFET